MDIAYIFRDLWDSKQENSMKELKKIFFYCVFQCYCNALKHSRPIKYLKS